MGHSHVGARVSAVFITFPGNCKKALTFYQTCFGGTLQVESFEKRISGYTDVPVIIGTLFADRVIIHGSDLVHDEGRTLGNYMSIFLPCKDVYDRQLLIQKLVPSKKNLSAENKGSQTLIEVTDAFDVRWILAL